MKKNQENPAVQPDRKAPVIFRSGRKDSSGTRATSTRGPASGRGKDSVRRTEVESVLRSKAGSIRIPGT